ncbi:MAG: matrixin family metalloprotease [Chthoniobacterales bacterium]
MTRSQPSASYSSSTAFPKLLAVAAAAAFAFSGAPKANAYAYEDGSPHWGPGTVTFVLSLGGGRTLSDGSSSFDAAAVAALATWNQYMGSLQLNIVTNDGSPLSQGDGVNSVGFSSSFFGHSFGSNTLGITGYSWSTGGRLTEANTLLNNRWTWDSYRGPLRSATDIRRVLIHEIGHALGLDHPDDHGQHVAAVMNAFISNTDTAVTDDIDGIQSIYGARSGGGSTPTPTPTPRPSATPTPTPRPTVTPSPTPNTTPTPAARVAMISAAPTVVRVGDTATFTVTLSSANSSPVVVNYMVGGTARSNLYTLSGTPGHVTIPAGSTSANFSLTPTSRPRRARTATMFLLSGSGYSVASPRSASVTLSR